MNQAEIDTLYQYSLKSLENKDFEQALDGYSTLVKEDPNFVQAWYDLASIYLLHKNFIDGFAFYEYRFLFQSHIIHRNKLPAPFYKGESLENKTVFIFTEQGFGDTIQFIRFINTFLSINSNTQVILYVQEALQKLLQYNYPNLKFVNTFNPNINIDYSISLLSLPFNLKIENINPLDQYLYVNKNEIIHSPKNNLKIGICWQGNKGNIRDQYRSIELEKLLLYIPENIKLYSLQKDIKIANPRVIDKTDTFNNFYDTACFIESLDLVITVDTAIAHLSGALGKPTFLLLPYLNDWRWGIAEHKSYWYKNTFLFRQNTKKDWDTTLSNLKLALYGIIE